MEILYFKDLFMCGTKPLLNDYFIKYFTISDHGVQVVTVNKTLCESLRLVEKL